MKRFLVLAYQGNGCDYTIGCGMAYEIFNANSPKEALDKWADGRDLNLENEPGIVRYYLPGGEGELEWVKVFEIGDADNRHLWEEFLERKETELAEAEKKLQKEKELAEFERLKKKLGK